MKKLLRITATLLPTLGAITSAWAVDPGTYKIGFVADRTGVVAFAGISYAQGAQLAVEQINASGSMGQGAKLEIVEREGGSDVAKSIQGYNQLIADRSVIATSCCIFSNIAGALKAIAVPNKVPLVFYGATMPNLPSLPWAYNVTGLPGLQEIALSKHLVEVLKPKTVAYFVLSDNDAFQARYKASREIFEASGAKTVGVVTALGADTDFTAQATEVISYKPDLIMVYVTQIPASSFIAAVRARGWAGRMATNEAVSPAAVFKKVGPALAGVPFSVGFASDVADSDAGKAFVSSYNKKFGADPDVYAAQGFTAMQLIAQGMQTLSGKPTREQLAEAMAKLPTIRDDVYGGVNLVNGQVQTKQNLFLAWSPEGKIVRWKP
ncbi:ABC transporter substrate-binding protein [Variovorax sp. PBL-E5]|uniref:ABC transporter substrate-binding protein n=1 Tax=Variovorax sp. PBL-E5 TaxID=434014 RepID=UPI0013A5A5FD|nr:ABC transporter substrate-binding protein [Variovorax sp. PBL-E5]